MAISNDDVQKAMQITNCLDEYFKTHPVSRIQAKELMPEFISTKIFIKNHRDGLPIRNFLRHLEKENHLHLIPHVHFEQKQVNKFWYFINTAEQHLSNISEVFPAKHQQFYDEFDPWRIAMAAKDVPTGGVYILKANRKVFRLLDQDLAGILYIGKGEILDYHNRVGKFVNSLNKTEEVHEGGYRFNMERIKDQYPLEFASIRITLSENPEKLEATLLNDYYEKFGELPPFNRRMENI